MFGDQKMTDIYPIALAVTVLAVWLAFFVQHGRMYRAFRRTFPDVARQRIPFAFDHIRHPEKVFFFYRKSSIEMLKRDQTIWRLRQQVLCLTALAFLVPFCGIAIGMAYAAWSIFGNHK